MNRHGHGRQRRGRAAQHPGAQHPDRCPRGVAQRHGSARHDPVRHRWPVLDPGRPGTGIPGDRVQAGRNHPPVLVRSAMAG